MKVRGASLNGYVDDSARASSILRTVIGREGAKLGNSVRVDVDEVVSAAAVVLVIGAVEIPRKGVSPAAVNGLAAVVDAVAAEQAEAAAVSSRDTGEQLQKLREISSVQLDLAGLRAGNQIADFA